MDKKGQAELWMVVLIAIVMIVVVIGFLGFDIVDASHIGVKNRFGEIKGTMQPGLGWTGLATNVYQYNLRVRKMTISMSDGITSSVDKDGQSVFANIEINYRLKPDSVVKAYENVGRDRNGELEDILNIEGIIKEGFKQATSEYTSIEIWQQRQEVKELAIEKIKSNFPDEYFTLETVVVGDLDFNKAFKAAIEAKKTNEELAKAKEKEVDIERFEADRKIEIARGNAESRKLDAEAAAYEMITAARSEAEGLGLKRKELTPLMIQNNWIDAWNGALPKYIFGDTGILLSMPMPDDTIKETIYIDNR